MPRRPKPSSREEALTLLSRHLRKPDLPANLLVKLTALYAKLSGWKPGKHSEPSESSIDQQIIEIERKRKSQPN